MSTKILALVTIVVVIIAGAGLYFFTKPKDLSPNVSPVNDTKKEARPSETFIEYTDPSGFSFSYPDNVSIEKNEVDDNITYADLQLFSKDVSGSLSFRITDTKLKNLEDWAKEASTAGATTRETQLGNLKALEVKTGDRLMLGAIDQGVSFNIELPLIAEDFWMKVYEKVLSDFSFTSPESVAAAAAGSVVSSDDVVFEGEEVIE